MNSGDLRNRVEVWANVKYEDELGGISRKFIRINTLWASIIPQTGSLQKQQADTILTNVTHKVVVRYTAGMAITKDMQLFYKGRRFEIKYILNPYERDESLEIFCQELMD